MFGYYDTTAVRQVQSSNYNLYKLGVLHPDRIMPEHDLVYIINGSWEIYQDNFSYTAKAGDVILLHAGHHHYGQIPCDDSTKTMFIHIAQSTKDYLSSDNPAINNSEVMIKTITHCQHSLNIKHLFEEIINTFWSQKHSRDSKLSALCQLLFCGLSECIDDTYVKDELFLLQVLKLIQTAPQKFYSSEQLSNEFFMSERTLRNKFLKICGKTPSQYQMEIKLQSACVFLENHPSMPLREIASNLGFYDEFHFSKTFKKRYMLSPTEYKNQKGQKDF